MLEETGDAKSAEHIENNVCPIPHIHIPSIKDCNLKQKTPYIEHNTKTSTDRPHRHARQHAYTFILSHHIIRGAVVGCNDNIFAGNSPAIYERHARAQEDCNEIAVSLYRIRRRMNWGDMNSHRTRAARRGRYSKDGVAWQSRVAAVERNARAGASANAI